MGLVACVWPLACALGEGPVWWRDALWFTDIKQKTVHRFDPRKGRGHGWQAPSEVGFLAPLENGHFIAGAKAGLYDFDPDSGDFVLIRTVEPHRPSNRLNDGAVDSTGRLWFGSMDDDEAQPSGMLYRFYRGSADGFRLCHHQRTGLQPRWRHSLSHRYAGAAHLCL